MTTTNHHIYDNMIMNAFIKPQYLNELRINRMNRLIEVRLDGDGMIMIKLKLSEILPKNH